MNFLNDQIDELGGLAEGLVLDGKGGARRIPRPDINNVNLEPNETLWLHWNRSDPDAQKWLRQESGLDAFVCDLLLEESTRPRIVMPAPAQLLLFMRGINLNQGSEPEDMVSLRIFVEKSRVISIRLRPLRARIDVSEELAAGKGPTSAQHLVLRLAEHMTDKVDPPISELAEIVDYEDEQLDQDEDYQPDHNKMVMARRRSAGLRRFLAPQRDIFFELAKDKFAWFADNQAKDWNELGNSLTRHLEELELIRERISLVLETEHQRREQKMNRVVYLFAIITGFFLPLSFLTGLMGINLGGIPGSDSRIGFELFCVIVLGVGLFQWWLFRRFKWL